MFCIFGIKLNIIELNHAATLYCQRKFRMSINISFVCMYDMPIPQAGKNGGSSIFQSNYAIESFEMLSATIHMIFGSISRESDESSSLNTVVRSKYLRYLCTAVEMIFSFATHIKSLYNFPIYYMWIGMRVTQERTHSGVFNYIFSM